MCQSTFGFACALFFNSTLIIGAITCYALPAHTIEIPTGMSRADLKEVTHILGYNTSSKFLSNPFPLGGYSGFEIGFATEFINTSDLSRLGTGQSDQQSFQYNRITIGKGLYNNLDFFVNFIPFSSSNEVSEYGGLMKWNFYQAKYLPLTFSALIHGSTINIEDLFTNEALGWNLMAGINMNRFALYFGAGDIRSRSTFARAVLDSALTPSLNSKNTLITVGSQGHSFVGLHIDLGQIFLAAQIDRYKDPVYSAKLGLRF